MAGASNPLLQDGLAVLADLLPAGFSVEISSLTRRRGSGKTWILLRNGRGQRATCLVVLRGRVEKRDLDGLALVAAGSAHPVLVLARALTATARRRLPALGIGYCDLAGNARIELGAVGLGLQRDGAPTSAGRNRRGLRSLSGPMAGRVVRALVDLRPPYTLAALAEQARVEPSYVSRVLAFVDDAGWLDRRPHGRLAGVAWQPLLRRWAKDAPLDARGEICRFHCPRTVSDFLSQLARSGFLHALTGGSAYGMLVGSPVVRTAVLYVDDLDAAVAQFDLRPASVTAEIVLIKDADRAVFHRSREEAGLRYVSPSLMAADLDDPAAFEAALDWMAKHEAAWRPP
jgi:hypothetical protein